uniref:RING-type domain-containing protein n=2 Tax=Hordeum vulgare subsp. vulgare TaxID=112509 RepID=A0A8I6WBL3_HORVV
MLPPKHLFPSCKREKKTPSLSKLLPLLSSDGGRGHRLRPSPPLPRPSFDRSQTAGIGFARAEQQGQIQAMETHHHSVADGRDVDGPASWTAIRHRLSRDFILRHEEARVRAAEAQAALNGDHWEWDDDGSYVVIDPASMKAMVAMETPKVGETREQGCAVCLEGFVSGGEKLRMMPCSHSFHQRCIFDLLLRSRFCPVCRFEMPPLSADEPEPVAEKAATTSEQVGSNSTGECPSTENTE